MNDRVAGDHKNHGIVSVPELCWSQFILWGLAQYLENVE